MSTPPSFLRRMLLAAFVLAFPQASFSQAVTKPLPLNAPLQDKNFYLLSLLQKNAEVRRALVADQEIAEISAERKRSVERELAQCKENVACTLKGLLWNDEEIHAVSLALARLYRENKSLRLLVDKELRPSGAYVLYQKQSGDNLLANAWDTCARGLNDVISVYGEGTAPRYPLIDSYSFDVNSADYQQRVHSLVSDINSGTSSSSLFFDLSLNSALQLLALNHRDEAGRLEPMETGVNAAAVKAIAATPWNKFAYSVIVVPGAGPGDRDTALSNSGRKRVQLAAEAYHAGKAPFILVSGGYVHPSQTRFSEAVEMKKALLQDFNVPESAILIDPHARHTTTNMRNAAREIYRYGVPMNKTALVISDAAQVGYIAGQPFADRCLKELGYMPYRILSQPSDTSLAFLPLVESLEQDPIEPLDP
ncbi:YdcF family protein [Acidicapsa acidisoli]|uniref:YdcF family protein n=1 Tax=Acidicapsa acidisoli TaxID=1615681 RepID=UPI0021DFD353|nr:YdcF family protein [Acidicapsa acidisoli]